MRTQGWLDAVMFGGAVALATCLAACAGQTGDGDPSDGTSTDAFVSSNGPNEDTTTATHRGDRENVRSTTSALREEKAEPNPDPWHGAGCANQEPNPDPWNPGSHNNETK